MRQRLMSAARNIGRTAACASSPQGGLGWRGRRESGAVLPDAAEADDAIRAEVRQKMHEPHRTLPGHFRHEIVHYYWQIPVRGGTHRSKFREITGAETGSYR